MKKKLTFYTLIILTASGAYGQSQSGSLTMGMAKKSEDKPKVSGSFNATHYEYANQNIDPSTLFNLRLGYKLTDHMSLAASQTLTKLYEINEGEEEVLASDTSLSFSHRYGSQKDNGIANFSYGLHATLPVSKFSREQDHVTVAGITHTASRSFLDDKLSTSLGLLYYYHVNQYKSIDQDDGGAYLIQQQYGASASISYQLPFDLSATWYSYYRQRRYENDNITPNHRYYFDGSVSYQATKKLVATAGYSQVDLAEKYGSVDVVLYDIEATSYYGGVSYTF